MTNCVVCVVLTDLPDADKLSVIIGVDVVVVESKLGDNTVGAGVIDVVADVVLTDGELIVIVVGVLDVVVDEVKLGDSTVGVVALDVVADAVLTDGELIVLTLIACAILMSFQLIIY